MNVFLSDVARQVARPAAWRVPVTILLGSLLMILSAKLKIPFWPVPMTMQVFAVCLLAGLAGGRMAAAMMLTYLAYGVAGLPVFANATQGGAGLISLLGPTGGYLAGFVVAAFIVGEWIQRRRPQGLVGLTLPMLAGLGIIYLLGCLWLASFVGWESVIAVGVLPFLLGDILKVLLAAAMTLALPRLRRVK